MSGFVKRYADAGAAREAWRRSHVLAENGVATPAVLGMAGERSLCFARVDGRTGKPLAGDDLEDMLSVVATVHKTPATHLPRFDPFLRIRPRLHIPTKLPVDRILADQVPQGSATLHGDLHVGQVIQSRNGKIWLVDLDDLAEGTPEADLANFAAHLATSGPSRSIEAWSDRVCGAWVQIGEVLDRDVFGRFLRIALLRRHLKLREAGRPDFEAEILAYLRDNSNFSIR